MLRTAEASLPMQRSDQLHRSHKNGTSEIKEGAMFVFQQRWANLLAAAVAALSLCITGPATAADQHSASLPDDSYYLVQPQAKDFAASRGRPDVSAENAVIDELYQKLMNPDTRQ
jgi:hypothetical protein